MGLWMPLWVVHDRRVSSELTWLERCLFGERAVGAKTNDKPVSTNLIHNKARSGYWQGNNRCVNLARVDLCHELNDISMR